MGGGRDRWREREREKDKIKVLWGMGICRVDSNTIGPRCYLVPEVPFLLHGPHSHQWQRVTFVSTRGRCDTA